MRILMFTPYPPQRGGVAEYPYFLTQALLRIEKNLELHVIAPKIIEAPSVENRGRYQIHRVWKTESPLYPFSMINYMKKIPPTVVHLQFDTTFRPVGDRFYSYSYGGVLGEVLLVFALLLKILRIPRIVTIYSTWKLEDLKKKMATRLAHIEVHKYGWFLRLVPKSFLLSIGPYIFIAFSKVLCALFDAVIVQNELGLEVLTNEYQVSSKKVKVVSHMCPPANVLDQKLVKGKLGLKDKYVILFFGMISADKGLTYAIEALAKIDLNRDFIFIIAGRPFPELGLEYLDLLQSYIKKYGLKQKVLIVDQYIDQSRISFLFSAADLIILPYSVSVGSSGVLSIAASYGKAIVASKVGPLGESAKKCGAIIVKPGDVKSLALAIEDALMNTEMHSIMTAKVNAYRRENAPKRVANKYLAIYQTLAEER